MKIGQDTKTRILAVERILKSAVHPMTADNIMCALLNRYDISVTRKVLYDDIAAITVFENVQHKKGIGYWIEKD